MKKIWVYPDYIPFRDYNENHPNDISIAPKLIEVTNSTYETMDRKRKSFESEKDFLNHAFRKKKDKN